MSTEWFQLGSYSNYPSRPPLPSYPCGTTASMWPHPFSSSSYFSLSFKKQWGMPINIKMVVQPLEGKLLHLGIFILFMANPYVIIMQCLGKRFVVRINISVYIHMPVYVHVQTCLMNICSKARVGMKQPQTGNGYQHTHCLNWIYHPIQLQTIITGQ